MNDFKHFRFWCQKILPLVYEDSLSYYELLCKVVKYINNLIDSDKEIIDDINGLRQEIAQIQKWIDEFDVDIVERLIEDNLLKMIVVGLDDNGYIVYYIASSWDDITFNTSGLDIVVPDTEYGRLVLSY